MQSKVSDIFEFSEGFTIENDINESVVDGINVLARVKGPFFAYDYQSKNGRYYSKKLWENALTKNESLINQRAMIGSVGHDIELDDKAFREGKVSHIITKLNINEDENSNVGIGECIILNTPTGQNLNTYLRAGGKIAISSRALGQYKGTRNGAQILDENSYVLEGFDFVLKPGIDLAYPKVVESIQNTEISSTKSMESLMSNELIEKLTADKHDLTTKLNEALLQISDIKNQLSTVTINYDKLESKHESLQEDYNRVSQTLSTTVENIDRTKNQVKLYESLGEPDALSKMTEELNKYREIGTVEQAYEALTTSTKVVDGYLELGSAKEINEAFDTLEIYTKLGTIEEIKESLSLLNSYYSKVGPFNRVEKLQKVIESYKELGSPEELGNVLKVTEGIVSANRKKSIKKLCENYRVSEEVASEAVSKLGPDGAEKMFSSVGKTNTVATRYEMKNGSKINEDTPKDDFQSQGSNMNKSRLVRVMEGYSK